MIQIPIDDMQRNASSAEALLKSLANSHRLMILCHLVNTERSVGELESLVGLSQSALSQHLAKLREQGIVSFRKSGTTVWYRVEHQETLQMLETLHAIYCA